MQTATRYSPEVIRESPTQYAVSSQSDISRWYTVTVAENVAVSCTCPARVTCKHMRITTEHIALEQAPRPLPQPIYGTCVNCGRGFYTIDPDAPCSCGKSRTVKEQPKVQTPAVQLAPGISFKPAPAAFAELFGR